MLNILLFQVLNQIIEADFAAITQGGKHRLAEKKVAQTHPVQAAYELLLVPKLDTVCVAMSMSLIVGLNHFGVNPDTGLLSPARPSADHVHKGLIQADPV